MRIIKGILMVAILLVVLAGIGWIALGVISSCMGPSNVPDVPDADEAAYTVTIENTGKLIMTNDYEVMGTTVGKRVFVLHGWWEFLGQDFKFKSGDIVLDESVFGKITLKKR